MKRALDVSEFALAILILVLIGAALGFTIGFFAVR
jgi:hypothetical protein